MHDEVERMLALLNAGFPRVEEMDAHESRTLVAARVQPAANLDDVQSAEDLIATDGDLRVPVRVYTPHGGSRRRPAIVFAHGGGWVFCSVASHDSFCRAMSRALDAVVVSVEYRLAPEARAPAAAEDTFAALRWTAAHANPLGIDQAAIMLAGDSAGGNLAAAVALMARDRGWPELRGQVLLYPVIEPDFSSPSYQKYADGHFNTRAAMEWYWAQYLPPNGPTEPAEYSIPAMAASQRGLPPAVILTAGRDPLCAEGERYARRLRAAEVSVRHRIYPELFHGFATIMAGFDPAEAARDLLWADIRSFLLRPGPTVTEGTSL